MSLFSINLEFLAKKYPDLVLPKNIWVDELLALSDATNIPIDVLLRVDLNKREEARSKNIRLVVFDIDGVMTDGGMFYTESGDEFKKFNAKDGLAVRALAKRGIATGIISHGFNTNLIQRRAERLLIERVAVDAVTPKLETLNRWCAELNITPQEVCFIGDDLNDTDIIQAVGFSACPADAVAGVKAMVHVILRAGGGAGCVRELVDEYLS
jgi:3-deoxy-D-manno-octulosonate 8-phosphate phosphatase (KDO 8-P phosphatase)